MNELEQRKFDRVLADIAKLPWRLLIRGYDGKLRTVLQGGAEKRTPNDAAPKPDNGGTTWRSCATVKADPCNPKGLARNRWPLFQGTQRQ